MEAAATSTTTTAAVEGTAAFVEPAVETPAPAAAAPAADPATTADPASTPAESAPIAGGVAMTFIDDDVEPKQEFQPDTYTAADSDEAAGMAGAVMDAPLTDSTGAVVTAPAPPAEQLTAADLASAGGAAKPGGSSKPNPFSQNISRTSPATVVWLHQNYEAAEGVSLGRSTLYEHYQKHCDQTTTEPVNPASFGKLIRSVFRDLKTRRLGTRGNSKYHYYGIRVKNDSTLKFSPDQVGGPHQRIRAGGPEIPGRKIVKNPKSESKEGDDSGGSNIDMGHFIDTEVELPEFPQMNLVPGLETAADFNQPYYAHCKDILKTLGRADFLTQIPEKWSQFWGVVAIHFRDVLGGNPGVTHVDACDEIFFSTMGRAIFTDVLCNMPEELTKEIRFFAKYMEQWIKSALDGYSDALIERKLVRVRAFAHALRRYTSLNHLAQAAQAVLNDKVQTEQMLKDIKCIDFMAAIAQAEEICECAPETVNRIELDLKWALEKRFTLKQWASWLQRTMATALYGSANPSKEARRFLTRWSFYSSIVIRDLTLRSAQSFGSFHLLRLLYDEYIIYLVELIDTNPANAGTALLSVPAGCTRAMVEDYEPRPSVLFGGGGGGSGKRNGSDLEPASMKTPKLEE